MPELMFINKTAKSKSLSKSAGREKAKIFSHVQRGPAAGREEQQRRSRSTSANRNHDIANEKPNIRTRRSRPAPLEKSPVPENTISVASLNGLAATNGKHNSSPEPLPGETGSWNIVDPSAALRKYAAMLDDPDNLDWKPDFADTDIVTVDNVATAYMNSYFYKTQDACERFSAHTEIGDTFKYAVGLAETDVALRISLTCCASAALALITGDELHSSLTFQFKRLVLRHLREQLSLNDSSAVPESTILAISLLLWVECLEGNTDHAAAHVSALELMVNRFTSLEQVPLGLAITVFDFPFLCSAMMRTRPIPLPAATEATSISPAMFDRLETLAQRDVPLLGSRFSAEPTASALGSKLLSLIKRQRACRIFRMSCRNKVLEPSEAENQAFAAENMQVSHALVMMAFEPEPLSPLQNAVRIAVFASFQTIVPIMGPSTAFCESMFQQLGESIDQIDLESLWAPKIEVLLWVALVCARLAHTAADWQWAVQHMNYLITISGFDTLEKVSDMLSGYFYTGVLCRSTLEKVWEERTKYTQQGSPNSLSLFGWV